MSWSISVKTVGAQGTEHRIEGTNPASCAKPPPTDFTLEVDPDDPISALHAQIEGVTGLKAAEQRLIYRGKLLPNVLGAGKASDPNKRDGRDDEKSRIRDVSGLSDGHTIHLVPRPSLVSEDDGNRLLSASPAEGGPQVRSDSSEPADSRSGSSSAASILGALLGLGSGTSATSTATSNAVEAEPSSPGARSLSVLGNSSPGTPGGRALRHQQTRNARSAARQRRLQASRLTAADLNRPDPGSLEPVRQGLMTVHTLLHSLPKASDPDPSVDERTAPQRRWFRGQWIDCRDTVNQWLEATIVDIVLPEEILSRCPSRLGADLLVPPRETSRASAVDPAVPANDFEGRRRLLLEPCDDCDGSDSDDNFAFSGFRERPCNEQVQLLLIHYNGWPHRWDEWIRSDSERIRPFRTRTRHLMNRNSHASPTPQSAFHAAPATYIRGEANTAERTAVLGELRNAIARVSDLLGDSECVPEADSTNENLPRPQLPWRDTTNSDANDDGRQPGASEMDRDRLELLAPLLDRLGRTLTDAAPHVAALATSTANENVLADPIFEPTSRFGDLSEILGTPNRDEGGTLTSVDGVLIDRSLHPDLVDFTNGMVNVSRGGDGRGSREAGGLQDDFNSSLGNALLRAYLSAAGNGGSGPNGDEDNADLTSQIAGGIIRVGGANGNENNAGGPGIDIHIHAVVTGPGMIAGLGGTGTSPFQDGVGDSNGSRSDSSDAPTRENALSEARTEGDGDDDDDDDFGLFSDLYSDTPTPSSVLHLDTQSGNPGQDAGSRVNEGAESPVAPEMAVSEEVVRSPSENTSSTATRTTESSSPRRSVVGRMLRRALSRRSH